MSKSLHGKVKTTDTGKERDKCALEKERNVKKSADPTKLGTEFTFFRVLPSSKLVNMKSKGTIDPDPINTEGWIDNFEVTKGEILLDLKKPRVLRSGLRAAYVKNARGYEGLVWVRRLQRFENAFGLKDNLRRAQIKQEYFKKLEGEEVPDLRNLAKDRCLQFEKRTKEQLLASLMKYFEHRTSLRVFKVLKGKLHKNPGPDIYLERGETVVEDAFQDVSGDKVAVRDIDGRIILLNRQGDGIDYYKPHATQGWGLHVTCRQGLFESGDNPPVDNNHSPPPLPEPKKQVKPSPPPKASGKSASSNVTAGKSRGPIKTSFGPKSSVSSVTLSESTNIKKSTQSPTPTPEQSAEKRMLSKKSKADKSDERLSPSDDEVPLDVKLQESRSTLKSADANKIIKKRNLSQIGKDKNTPKRDFTEQDTQQPKKRQKRRDTAKEQRTSSNDTEPSMTDDTRLKAEDINQTVKKRMHTEVESEERTAERLDQREEDSPAPTKKRMQRHKHATEQAVSKALEPSLANKSKSSGVVCVNGHSIIGGKDINQSSSKQMEESTKLTQEKASEEQPSQDSRDSGVLCNAAGFPVYADKGPGRIRKVQHQPQSEPETETEPLPATESEFEFGRKQSDKWTYDSQSDSSDASEEE